MSSSSDRPASTTPASRDPMEATSARPRVSVIVRTRNRPQHLGAALRDILDQSFEDFEIVVVDDGDDPATVVAIVAAADDPRSTIRIVDRTTGPHGRALAANAGIRAACGEFLVIHDDDDAWAPEFLSRTVAYLDAHPGSVAVSARTEVVIHRVDDEGNPAGTDRGLLNQGLFAINIPDMLRANRVTTISLLYRAAVHDEIGMIDESLTVHEDWDFYLRLIARRPIDLLPLPALAQWHQRPGQTGDAGNSVFALDDEHHASKLRIGDDHIRDSIGRVGSGAARHLAYEMQRLDEILAEDRATATRRHDELIGRIDQLGRRVDEVSVQLDEASDRLEERIVTRTSVSGFFSRARSLLSRRS